ncbi:MAG TPA: trigger factor [Patescibacteria group bacterium]|nr:trigger factor [Patescibacteria group bacterium]
MISALNKQTDGTIELTITIPKKKVKVAYDLALKRLAKDTEINGFRKGKAPLKKVEEKVGKAKVHEEVLKFLVPEVYLETLREQKIQPIINPQVSITSIEENKDWQIKAVTCELPKIELGDYQAELKKALASEKIWVPGKDKEEKVQEKESERLRKIFQILLETVKIKIPELLIQEEVNRMLSRLIDQTERLGLTVEQYLASIGKTSDQIRQEYRQQAEESLRLELILSAIADAEDIKITEKEVQEMINATPDEKAKEAMQTPTQQAYIKQLLRKRKAIDKLTKL